MSQSWTTSVSLQLDALMPAIHAGGFTDVVSHPFLCEWPAGRGGKGGGGRGSTPNIDVSQLKNRPCMSSLFREQWCASPISFQGWFGHIYPALLCLGDRYMQESYQPLRPIPPFPSSHFPSLPSLRIPQMRASPGGAGHMRGLAECPHSSSCR